MPQASDELRSLMKEYFGDEVSEIGAIVFLESSGYKLTEKWFWIPKEGVSEYKDMTQKEWECLLFLIDEWDFGGFA